MASYASSKASVANLSKSVALYCADKRYDIRSNSVHPAAIHTKMTESFLGSTPEERKKRLNFMEKSIPLKRLGQPREVAQLALFLASDDSSFITGSEFRIDGGSLSGAPSVSKIDD
jgi:3(or 17)beta-hydroxysteroid dehydrogenase